MKWTDKIEVTNEDNMALMSRYPDNYFDLAIVDPPYGINVIDKVYKGRCDYITYKGNGVQKKGNYKSKKWDKKTPTKEYFQELDRVSKKQIIWGANNFTDKIKPSSSWIFWDKVTGNNDFSDGEFAYYSLGGKSRKFTFVWNGMLQGKSISEGGIVQGNKKLCEKKIHPTQKPVKLYKWLLQNYAKAGDKILDTHLGSGSIALACHELGFELTACELDAEYYEAAHKRFQQQTAQLRLNLA